MDNELIGVYVHWPFCTRLCPYCDFNIYKNKPDLAFELTQAIVDDLRTWREASGSRTLASIHFGGGTPSLMSIDHLRAIIEEVQTLWDPNVDLEIALEANPDDISREKLSQWKSVGIERLSIGAQSFDDDVLKFLGRNHNSKSARRALEMAVDMIPRVSTDLIYGWLGQTTDHWRRELEQVLAIEPGHISTYQLTIEDKTAFARAEQRGDARVVDTDKSADLFDLVGNVLGEVGYDRYEVSNFAKTAKDQSRHNKLYWQGEDYVGVGPGAHGRLTGAGQRTATIATLKPQDYMEGGASFTSPVTTRELMSCEARAEEYVLMGLRISEGISLSKFRALSGCELPEEVVDQLVRDGLLMQNGDKLMATEQGRLVLDSVSHTLLNEP
ncbi:MAG: radical SAM family heme chaperone HemW [Hyphomonadaceae bacterium]|nr:radical SAM family heme chaperone HemW [Hyphomonadaceae bacterium]